MDILTPVHRMLMLKSRDELRKIEAETGVSMGTLVRIKYESDANPYVRTVQTLYTHLVEKST